VHRLAEGVRARGREISLTAVYRNVPLLIEAELIRPTLFSQGSSSLYELSFERPAHDHLVCRSCGAFVEFHHEALDALRKDVASLYAFELASHVHEMIGVCAPCRASGRR